MLPEIIDVSKSFSEAGGKKVKKCSSGAFKPNTTNSNYNIPGNL